LSAKYGFLSPSFTIPGPYDITFKDAHRGPITVDCLREQIRSERLVAYGTVVALGGKEYRSIVEDAFAPMGTAVVAPFARLPIGRYMQAVKHATATGQAFPGVSGNR
jgi:hypothetical protein